MKKTFVDPQLPVCMKKTVDPSDMKWDLLFALWKGKANGESRASAQRVKPRIMEDHFNYLIANTCTAYFRTAVKYSHAFYFLTPFSWFG